MYLTVDFARQHGSPAKHRRAASTDSHCWPTSTSFVRRARCESAKPLCASRIPECVCACAQRMPKGSIRAKKNTPVTWQKHASCPFPHSLPLLNSSSSQHITRPIFTPIPHRLHSLHRLVTNEAPVIRSALPLFRSGPKWPDAEVRVASAVARRRLVLPQEGVLHHLQGLGRSVNPTDGGEWEGQRDPDR